MNLNFVFIFIYVMRFLLMCNLNVRKQYLPFWWIKKILFVLKISVKLAQYIFQVALIIAKSVFFVHATSTNKSKEQTLSWSSRKYEMRAWFYWDIFMRLLESLFVFWMNFAIAKWFLKIFSENTKNFIRIT